MTRYRITLRICSPLITPLKGDTIWGHIAWGIANHEGEEGVAQFLQEAKTPQPSLVVSSAFPKGMVCRPLPEPQKRTGVLKIEDYAQLKQDKHSAYEPGGAYFSGIPPQKVEWEDPFAIQQVQHNKIDRKTNMVLADHGLYTVQEQWSRIREWDVYMVSSLDPDRIRQLFVWAFENGYGADASTGKGNILVQEDSVSPVTPEKKGNRYMALAPFVQNPQEPVGDLRGNLFIRTGKIGGAFSSVLSPYKKAVILFDEGAVFTSEKPLLYTGRLLEQIHQDPRICQSGFAPVIPIT